MKQQQTTSPQISLFAQGPTYCAVCAPRAASPDIIETVVALRNRGEPDAEWKILAGPFADGRPNPRLCPHDDLRQHWLVMRVPA
jgi:hypothetical protein